MIIRKRDLFGIIFCALVVLSVGIYRAVSHDRGIASVDEPVADLASMKIKSDMIKNIQWIENSDHFTFEIQSSDADFCKNWSSAMVTLAAEGVAVSGTPPQAQVATACKDQQFTLALPKKMDLWTGDVKTLGDFSVSPSHFYISQVDIEGPIGKMRISSAEIDTIRGQAFSLHVQ